LEKGALSSSKAVSAISSKLSWFHLRAMVCIMFDCSPCTKQMFRNLSDNVKMPDRSAAFSPSFDWGRMRVGALSGQMRSVGPKPTHYQPLLTLLTSTLNMNAVGTSETT
jgi:hypothetical protein